MCRVCYVETGTDDDVCELHDGKRPSAVIIYVWEPRNPHHRVEELRGKRCVIEATGGDDAIVRFVDVRPTRWLQVERRSLRRLAA